ncbi:hypothetical protein EMCG_03803 [[Emmonsia] crescens]|uniref:Alpha and gamma adaptin binding protein p34 n=1 Tax=[Emmonsia] crescens TaxID=73230 RepID=A0A0G2IZR7_9EURO|nr:hypothetical protein EMCG_03803 [Emmonsia crescens UAMH 3008]
MPAPQAQKEKLPSNTKAAPRISNPRRLLILTPAPQSHTIVPPFLRSLTGVAVTNAPQATNAAQSRGKADPVTPDIDAVASTFAGYTTHSPLRIETTYYTADIPIWVDELPFPYNTTSASSLSQSQSDESTFRETESQLPLPHHHSSAAWRSEFLSDEAREVRDVIGAVVVCIERPVVTPSTPVPVTSDGPDISRDREHRNRSVQGLKELLSAVAEVRNRIEEERGGMGEVPGLVILVGKDEGGEKAEGYAKGKGSGIERPKNGGDDGELEQVVEFGARWWEEELSEMGHFELEVVAWDPKAEEEDKRNIFGELQGMSRIREVLQTNEWTSTSQGDLSTDFLQDSDGETGFDKEANELEREMFGLRLAIEKGGDQTSASEPDLKNDDDEDGLHVEKMDGLMLRMQAIKDMAAELPEADRKAFAVKAINNIMKDI